jgi:putative MATE family efflux protein
MVGSLGAAASAAVGLSSSVVWFISSIAGGFGIGILALCAQADGAGNRERMQKAGQQAFFLTLMVGIPMTVLCLAVSPFLPMILGADPSIHAEASAYFTIISTAYLFRASTIILACALRGVSSMKTPMFINLCMNVINIIFNFILIYPTRNLTLLGKTYDIKIFGADLGVKGAASATAISLFAGGLLMFLFYCKNKTFDIKHTGLHYDKKTMAAGLKIGIPSVMCKGIVCLGHVAFSSLLAKLGVVQFAAHTLAIQAEQAFYIPGYGFQAAASTLAGNAVGENDLKKVRQSTYLLCGITFALMFVAGIVLFVFAEPLVGIFTPDREVIELGAAVLRMVAVSEPVYGVLVILEGIFNGLGDTKAPFVYSLITMWGIRIGGAALLIYLGGMGLRAAWAMMIADNVARCVMLTVRFFKGSWKRSLPNMTDI